LPTWLTKCLGKQKSETRKLAKLGTVKADPRFIIDSDVGSLTVVCLI
jgi:hypothetical protein